MDEYTHLGLLADMALANLRWSKFIKVLKFKGCRFQMWMLPVITMAISGLGIKLIVMRSSSGV